MAIAQYKREGRESDGKRYQNSTSQGWFVVVLPLSVGHPGHVASYCQLHISIVHQMYSLVIDFPFRNGQLDLLLSGEV